MAKKTKSKSTTALLLLDYCTIKDAAKLVNCKVKNILQLASEGKITLMVNFDEWGIPAYGYVSDRTGQVPDLNGNVKLSCGRAWYSDIAVTEDEGVVSAKLGGIWSVPPAWVYGSLIGKPSDSLMVFASPDIMATSNIIEATAEIHGVDISYPPYLISNEILTILKQCIESEQLLPCNTDPQHPANNPQYDIPNSELVAKNADLAKQLQQARDEIACLTKRLSQAEAENSTAKLPGYLDPQHPRYPNKLAVAIAAWEAFEMWEGGGTVKQGLKYLVKERAAEYDLVDKNGQPTELAIEECSKVANWVKGGPGIPRKIV